MAKKRINKKVALIGSVLLLLMLLGAIVVILKMTKDPDKLVAYAKQETQNEDYEQAIRYYAQALNAVSGEPEREMEILRLIEEFHKIDNEQHPYDWDKLRGTWNRMINIDPSYIPARKSLMDFFYRVADNGSGNVWKMVENNANEIIDIYEKKGVEPDTDTLMALGRAKLELARTGQATNREQTLSEAIETLNKVRTMDPDNYNVYDYISRAELIRGEIESSKGLPDARAKAIDRSLEVLEEAVTKFPENPQVHISLINTHLIKKQENREEDLSDIEAEFSALENEFPQSAEVYSAQAIFYKSDIEKLDKAINASSKAIENDPQNVGHLLLSANLYFRDYITNENLDSFKTSVEIARSTLDMPDTQEVKGPRQFRNKSYRIGSLSLLAQAYLDRAMQLSKAGQTEQNREFTKKAQAVIEELEQLFGSGDNLEIQKWKGILDLAKGQDQKAIRRMHSAYEQIRATERHDAFLASALAEAFTGSENNGIRREFIWSAIQGWLMSLRQGGYQVIRPELILDYADITLDMLSWNEGLSAVAIYENIFGESDRTRLLKARGYVGSGRFDQAREIFNSMETKDSQAKIVLAAMYQGMINRLRSPSSGETPAQQNTQIEGDIEELLAKRNEMIEDLVKIDSDDISLSIITPICNYYLNEEKKDKAVKLVEQYIKVKPDDYNAKIFLKRLEQPEPLNIPQDKMDEITLSVLDEIRDEYQKEMVFADYYINKNEIDQAVKHYQNARKAKPEDFVVLGKLFEIYVATEQLEKAQEIAEYARDKNIDLCEGNLFLAELAISQGDYEQALRRLNNCLEFRPLYPTIYSQRSVVNEQLGNIDQAIEDAKKAIHIKPMDNITSKRLAGLLARKYVSLGKTATIDLYSEVDTSFRRAILLNPRDWQIQSMYASFINEKRPDEALAIHQRIAESYPNVINYVKLGNNALQMALEEISTEKKQSLFSIAEDAFKTAYEIDPSSELVVNRYSEFLRQTGKQDKIQELFKDNKNVIWRTHFRNGQYQKAFDVLESLYSQDSENVQVLKGLTMVAQRLNDPDKVKKYSSELIQLNDTITNRLIQVESYIEVGLLDEAGNKLESLKETNPNEKKLLLLESWLYIANGQVENSLDYVNRYLQSDPESAVAWNLKAQVCSFLGLYDDAVEAYEKSFFINSDPQTQVDLARAYLKAGRNTEAISELQKAVQNDRAPRTAMGMLEQLYIQSNRDKDLEAFYAQILDRFPDEPYWYFRAGNYYYQKDRFSRAHEFFEKAWTLSLESGGNIAALDAYLETLRKTGNDKKFLEIAGQYTDSKFAVVAYSHLAQEKFDMGSRAAATEYYRKALDKASTNQMFIYNILKNMKDTVGQLEVAKWCNEKIDQNPNSVAANIIMYELAMLEEEYNRAVNYIDKALDIVDPQTGQWLEYMGMKAKALNAAYMKTSTEDYLKRSIDVYEKIIEVYPDNSFVLNNLAYLLADNNQRVEDAVKYAKTALAQAPNNQMLMDTYGYALIKAEQYEKAEQTIIRSIQIFEREEGNRAPWDVYYHLGMAQQGLGKKYEAMQAFRQSLDLAGDDVSEERKQEIQSHIDKLALAE